MDKNLKQKIAELKEYGEKPVGVFGARASGKTMFFTVLYGLSGFSNKEGKFSIMCNDDDTRKYLSKNYSYISSGELLPRTEINDIKKVLMNYVYNENSYNLRSFDFAGELLKENTIEEKEIASVFLKKQEKIYSFFSNCSSILIFLEPTDDTKETLKRQTEIDKLLGILREAKGREGQKVPLGIVVTKWDKINPEVADSTENVEEKKVLEYIKGHKVYKNIYNLLSGVSEEVKVFPISSFGHSREGDYPPDDLTNPFNVFAPLIWASKMRDRDWSNKIKIILKQNVPLKDAKDIIESYSKNVENRDMLDEVMESFKDYNKRLRNKKIMKTIAGIFVVIAVTGGIYGIAQKKNMMFSSAKFEKDKKKQIEKIEKFVMKYGESDKKSKELIDLKMDALIIAIDVEIDEAKKLELIRTFLKTYEKKDPKKTEIVLNKKAEIEKKLESAQFENKLKKESSQAYADLTTQISVEVDNLKKYRMLKSFVQSYPDYKDLASVNEDMNKYLKLADREKYKEIEDYMKSGINEDTKIFDRIEEYLAIADFVEYKKEVSAIKESLREEDLYRLVRTSVEAYNQNSNRNTFKEVIVKTANYRANNKTGKYLDKVNNYINQVKAIEKGVQTEIEVYLNSKRIDLKGKKAEIKLEIGKQVYYITKDNINDSIGKDAYIGSKTDKLSIDTNIYLTMYITDSSGKESEFGPEVFKLESINSYKNVGGIDVVLRTNTDKFKIK
jgi:hypothetical protein